MKQSDYSLRNTVVCHFHWDKTIIIVAKAWLVTSKHCLSLHDLRQKQNDPTALMSLKSGGKRLRMWMVTRFLLWVKSITSSQGTSTQNLCWVQAYHFPWGSRPISSHATIAINHYNCNKKTTTKVPLRVHRVCQESDVDKDQGGRTTHWP